MNTFKETTTFEHHAQDLHEDATNIKSIAIDEVQTEEGECHSLNKLIYILRTVCLFGMETASNDLLMYCSWSVNKQCFH